MDPHIRAALHTSRAADLFNVFQTTFFAQVGLIAVISFADAPWLPVAVATISVAIFGFLAADAAMKDLAALRDSMDEETRSSPYGRAYANTPYPAFRALTGIINAAIAVSIILSA